MFGGCNEGAEPLLDPLAEDDAVKANSLGTVRPNFEGDRENREEPASRRGGARLTLRACGSAAELLPVDAAKLAGAGPGRGKASDRLGLREALGLSFAADDDEASPAFVKGRLTGLAYSFSSFPKPLPLRVAVSLFESRPAVALPVGLGGGDRKPAELADLFMLSTVTPAPIGALRATPPNLAVCCCCCSRFEVASEEAIGRAGCTFQRSSLINLLLGNTYRLAAGSELAGLTASGCIDAVTEQDGPSPSLATTERERRIAPGAPQ